MPLKHISALTAVWICVICATSAAGPRILEPDDPEGAEVRAVASQFIEKLSNLDILGVDELFAGPPDQKKLLESQIHLFQTSEKLRAAAIARFGKSAQKQQFVTADTQRNRLALMRFRRLILNGDFASLSRGFIFDSGLGLQRISGHWKVTQITITLEETAALEDFFATLAAEQENLQADILAGKFESAEAAFVGFGKELGPKLSKLGSYARSEPPNTARDEAARTSFNQSPALAEKQFANLLGTELKSAKMANVIASMSGNPYLEGEIGGEHLFSKESGVDFWFGPPFGGIGKLGVVIFYADGADGYAQYAGELPHGLLITDRRRDVERKIGRPPLSNGGPNTPYRADYPTLGLWITYGKNTARDPDNVIHSIRLRNPDSAGDPPIKIDAHIAAQVAFRLVARENAIDVKDAEELADPDNPGKTIRVRREVLFDQSAISDIYGTPGFRDRQPSLSLSFTDQAARKLEQISKANQGIRIAIVWNDKVIVAPIIRGIVSQHVIIDLTDQNDTYRIGARIHAAINALPAEVLQLKSKK